ncbi:ATP synthase subunit d, mitochondrial-like [Osmia bicornis bicornis]|uniref:ATP synthase subunit d, mitochondrial-like n=1 Tax=Osmia bicornis bicornis TaxID=1437191 RepID=UPI001EAF1B2E|nr:ATP synthase subunit d, mitochondrial-like [Osmia bicornis bicornis]
MSRRAAITAINWTALAERVPESEKASFSAFRSKSDQILQRMVAHPEAPPTIDWEYYKKHVSATNLVDKFQKEFQALSVPYPADKYTADIEAKKQEAAKDIEAFTEEANRAIKEIELGGNNIKNMLPFNLMTMEDYTILFPEGTWSKTNISLWPHTEDAQDSPEDDLEPDDDH